MNPEQIHERYFLEAARELDDGKEPDAALWAKAMALSEGDTARAQHRYIQLRAVSLSEQTADHSPHAGGTSQRLKARTLETSRPSGADADADADADAVDGDLQIKAHQISPPIGHVSIDDFADAYGISPEHVPDMLESGLYQGIQSAGTWFVSKNELPSGSTSDTGKETFNEADPCAIETSSVLRSIHRGELSLWFTYWACAVGPGIMLSAAWAVSWSAQSPAAPIIALIALVALAVFVLPGVWRAASQYQGPRILSLLAKVSVLIFGIRLLGYMAVTLNFLQE